MIILLFCIFNEPQFHIITKGLIMLESPILMLFTNKIVNAPILACFAMFISGNKPINLALKSDPTGIMETNNIQF